MVVIICMIYGHHDHDGTDHAKDSGWERPWSSLPWVKIMKTTFMTTFNITIPMPELRRTPQANQMAEVRFKDSSSFISLGSMLYLWKKCLSVSFQCHLCTFLVYLICLYFSYLLPAERREPVQEIEADCNDLQFNTLSKQIENNNLNYPKIIIVIMMIKTLATLTDTSTRIQRVYLNGWRKETSWEARGCCKWSWSFSW